MNETSPYGEAYQLAPSPEQVVLHTGKEPPPHINDEEAAHIDQAHLRRRMSAALAGEEISEAEQALLHAAARQIGRNDEERKSPS